MTSNELTHCGLVPPYGILDVIIGSGNGLLPGGTKPLPVPVLNNYQWDLLPFTMTCLMAPSHYLNQCWLTIGEIFGHLPLGNLTGNALPTISAHNRFELYFIKIMQHFPGAGIILCMYTTNERRRYNVTSSLIGWAHTQNNPCGGQQFNSHRFHQFTKGNSEKKATLTMMTFWTKANNDETTAWESMPRCWIGARPSSASILFYEDKYLPMQ